jgi:2-polyprenyl-3-methyl-5-hydroxy-6-metoxy-1,4-benzoquinol methylase
MFASVPEAARVLDVGTGTGQMGMQVRRLKRPVFLAGVEKDRDASEMARGYYDQFVVTDIEQMDDLPFPRDFFDVILLGDVLEHLRDPDRIIRTLTPFLAPRGRFLISVPNVAFASVRLSLLFGKFSYSQRGGILDVNHLKFYTRSSLTKFLENVGLNVIRVRGYNVVRLRFVFLKWLGWLMPTLFCLQFLAEAEKRQICDSGS